jgi:hypothetical protein
MPQDSNLHPLKGTCFTDRRRKPYRPDIRNFYGGRSGNRTRASLKKISCLANKRSGQLLPSLPRGRFTNTEAMIDRTRIGY